MVVAWSDGAAITLTVASPVERLRRRGTLAFESTCVKKFSKRLITSLALDIERQSATQD